MNILVAKNGSQLGPFSEGDIRAKLASGEFAPTDFAWREGMAAWSPLSQMFADAPPAPATAPYAPPVAQDLAPSPAPQPYNAPQGQYSAPQTYNSPYPAAYQPGTTPQWGAQGSSGYAGFWQRFGAAFIDGLILMVANFVVGLVIGILFGIVGASQDVLIFLARIVGVVVVVIYYALMESSAKQATVGKQAMGLKVTDLNGNRITLGKGIIRGIGRYISLFTFLIGYIMAAFTARKQALHDMMAGTLVMTK